MLKLKNLTLKSRIIQSPMAGCTDLAFRLIARRKGMEFAFLEMISADALVRQNAKTLQLLKTAVEDKPLGAQLVGCNPDSMGEAAQIIEELGFDLLDLNLGCPVPKITAPGGGSALLKEPETAEKLFHAAVKNVKNIPVTVKMRKGFSDPSGDEAVKIAKMAENAGVSAITVHGRTREQGYSGIADWQAIGKVKRSVKIPVIGNGDIVSGETAEKMLEESGCDGIMIGRGGLGNPWIYKSVEAVLHQMDKPVEPDFIERKKTALLHLDLEIETEGERVGVLKSRRILCWYFKNVPGVAEFRGKIHAAESYPEMKKILEDFEPSSVNGNPAFPQTDF